jgi:hypothetical protein
MHASAVCLPLFAIRCDPTTAETEAQFTKGSQWLVWRFESDATLGDALDGYLGPFPAGLEKIMLGKVRPEMEAEKRDGLVRDGLWAQSYFASALHKGDQYFASVLHKGDQYFASVNPA